MKEQRKHPRTRTFKSGRIVLNNGASTLDCVVKNISATGAKIVVETSVGIPDCFQLLIADEAARPCAVRWRKLKELGVLFD